MASFLSRFFSAFSGGSRSEGAAAPAADPEAYGDCLIHASPIREGNQLRLAGRIEKTIDGEVFERTFIRADVFTSMDDAMECTFRKGRQIVDQNGVSLFADGVKSRTT